MDWLSADDTEYNKWQNKGKMDAVILSNLVTSQIAIQLIVVMPYGIMDQGQHWLR